MPVSEKANFKSSVTQSQSAQPAGAGAEVLLVQAEAFAFINVRKAKEMVEEVFGLSDQITSLQQAKCHILAGFIENQLYNYFTSEQHYLQALALLSPGADPYLEADAHLELAGTYINLARYHDANAHLDAARKIVHNFPDPLVQSRIFCREGYINLHRYNYNGAIESFLEADKILQSYSDFLTLKDSLYHTLVHSGLGTVYEKNDQRDKSVKSFLQAVNLCESLNFRTRLSWHYINVGSAFLGLSDEEEAERYFQKAINSSDDISQTSRALAYGNLGFLALQKKDYDKAQQLLTAAEGLNDKESIEAISNLATINHWRGKLFAELGKNRKAQKHFKVAYQQASEVNDFMKLCAICKDFATFYADQGAYKEAYMLQELLEDFTDKYHEEIKERNTIELEVRFEAEKKKQEAELLRLQASKLQLKALRAQMNPHFMFNSLNSINEFISSGDTDNSTRYLSKFAKLMRTSLDYSDLEAISLDKEVEFLRLYLDINTQLRFTGKMSYAIEIADDVESDFMGIPTMIIQPYVENAIEHGLRKKVKDGFVSISFSLLDDDTLLCVVQDNGIGRAAARKNNLTDPNYQKHHSKGTIITEERLRLLSRSAGKDVFVNTIDLFDEQTGSPAGTRVEIHIPILDDRA